MYKHTFRHFSAPNVSGAKGKWQKKKREKFIQSGVLEDGNLNDGELDARSSGNDAFPSHGEGRGGEGWEGRSGEEGEEGEDVFRCGSCDEKRGERLETRGGEEGSWVAEDCALFIPADTSVSVIHLAKGISQQLPPNPSPTPTRDKRDRECRARL